MRFACGNTQNQIQHYNKENAMSDAKQIARTTGKIVFFIFSNLPFIAAGAVVMIFNIKVANVDSRHFLTWLGIAAAVAVGSYLIFRVLHRIAGNMREKGIPWFIIKIIEVAFIGGVYFLLVRNLVTGLDPFPQNIIAGVVAIAGYILWERRLYTKKK